MGRSGDRFVDGDQRDEMTQRQTGGSEEEEHVDKEMLREAIKTGLKSMNWSDNI